MKEKNIKKDGYFTVEAILVFVSILIIIFAIMYSLFLLYQNVVLINAATVGAQESAYIIASSQKESITEADIKNIVEKELKRGFFKVEDTKITVSQYGILQKKIRVNLKYKINFPMRNIAELIAGNEAMEFNVSSVARVTNRVTNIRTIDLIKEVGKRIKNNVSSFGWGVFEGFFESKY